MSAAAMDSRIHPAIGLHPWYWEHAMAGWADRMRQILVENPHLMVGEIGLDNARLDIRVQAKVFRAQYMMASELGRTVHVHCVHAWNLLQKICSTIPLPPAIVVHRFTASQEFLVALRKRFDNRIYYSFRDINNERMNKLMQAVPASRLLVESDDFAPRPDKIMALLSQIAYARGCSISQISEIIYNNTLRVISNGQIKENQDVIG